VRASLDSFIPEMLVCIFYKPRSVISTVRGGFFDHGDGVNVVQLGRHRFSPKN
jgi:hypothetical protein